MYLEDSSLLDDRYDGLDGSLKRIGSNGPFLFVLVVLVLDNIVCSAFVEGFTKYLPCVDVIAPSMLNNCLLGEADSPTSTWNPLFSW